MVNASDAHGNPAWARDELILALDLYFRFPPTKIRNMHPQVVELSEVLNRLPIHGDVKGFPKFRNPNGVYMKMCNFLRFDESYAGKGLRKGAQTEEIIWQEFANDREHLHETAKAIRANHALPEVGQPTEALDEEEESFVEGQVLYRLHRARERSPKLRERAKAAAIRSGRGLVCVVCGFNFESSYGELGKGFIECHHTVPVSQLTQGQRTILKDVALLCSNCHRMVHRRRPWLSINQLETLLVRAVEVSGLVSRSTDDLQP
jgi:5-methylcytosine-specific restriction protein A